MIHPNQILLALQEKEAEFEAFQHHAQVQRKQYHTMLEEFASRTYSALHTGLSMHDWPGALPTEEIQQGSICIPFSCRFSHHQEARSWAASILQGVTTFAVDGSQLMPSKEVSVPIAAVQVGWFLNPHDPNRPFEKQVFTEVIGPQELLASGSEDKSYHDQYISLKRYTLETQRIQQFFAQVQGQTPAPLAMFDGSLVLSFAEVLMEFHRKAYLRAVLDMLEASSQTQVSLLGYIDTSMARDLVRMLSMYFYRDPPPKEDDLIDTDLVDDLLPGWGDRTIAFRLKRPGILRNYDKYGDLGFLYLRAAMDRPPVRVEFPFWMYENGLLQHAIDLLCAELIVGNGYPYALETADQIAWFSPQDRSRFLGLVNAFLQERNLDFALSSKLQSKRRRR